MDWGDSVGKGALLPIGQFGSKSQVEIPVPSSALEGRGRSAATITNLPFSENCTRPGSAFPENGILDSSLIGQGSPSFAPQANRPEIGRCFVSVMQNSRLGNSQLLGMP